MGADGVVDSEYALTGSYQLDVGLTLRIWRTLSEWPTAREPRVISTPLSI